MYVILRIFREGQGFSNLRDNPPSPPPSITGFMVCKTTGSISGSVLLNKIAKQCSRSDIVTQSVSLILIVLIYIRTGTENENKAWVWIVQLGNTLDFIQ